MGLFEDIDRAWFTIDNKLFLWNYTDGYARASLIGARLTSADAISAGTTNSKIPFKPLDSYKLEEVLREHHSMGCF